jgi:hypothetical protein
MRRFRPVIRHRLIAFGVALVVSAGATACSENLQEGRAGCPALCPNQNVPVIDTTIDGLVGLAVDTTVTGYPAIGTEPELLVANGGDSLDVRGIIRFDSIAFEYRPKAADTLRPAVTAFLPYLRLRLDTSSFKSGGGVNMTIQAYDVDTIGNDTSVAVLASLFRPDRFLGQAQFDSLSDSVRIPLDSGIIAPHVRGNKRVRIGVRLTTTGRVDIRNASSGVGPVFSYFPATDTTGVPRFVSVPRSVTPVNDLVLQGELQNYPITVIGSSPRIAQRLDVGGMPARRVYLRFRLPSRIIDSATVVRATLTLSVKGFGGFLPGDSLTIFPQGVIATSAITDPTKAAAFVASSTLIGIDTVRAGPALADTLNIEIVNAVRRWSGHATDSVSRAIVLRIANEGADPLVASFFAAAPTVPAAQRPRIHIAYIRPVGFGLP